ncbi:MAG: hypothetical protein KGY75_06280 [Candidatus Cloacimonetes bacterium]|nr:hypothetical protein [Candidatus Cloacimonadota bacterium]MBS3767707.1 hypothetical protein [Candidatus Cloacimonadota bacterium]
MKKIQIAFILITIIILLPYFNLKAEQKVQSPDSTVEFTGKNATKAILYSAFIPGGGQFYNEKYIKAGATFSLELAFLGSGIYYQIKRENAWDDYIESGNQQDYDTYNDYHIKSQSMYWWFFAVKFVSVVDAYVDAKLFNYDKKKRQLELELEANSISLNFRF